MKAIINGKIILNDSIMEQKIILFEDKILDITDDLPDQVDIIDAKGAYVGAGLIDIHIHGAGGADVMDANDDTIETISQLLVKFGVTSFLPTTMTMSQEKIECALNQIRIGMNGHYKGAKVLGCHLEGPFISETYKGAQNKAFIQKPNMTWIEPFQDVIKLITLAPEVDEGYEFIKAMKLKTDIKLSMGHTSTTFAKAKEAIQLGISHATHTFNGMSGFNHREPGAVGAILMSDVSAELIADKIHVNPEIFEWFYRVKSGNIVLITDSMRAGCMPDGVYDLGGQEVIVENGSARLRTGSLAGSVLTLNKAVRNFYEETTLSLPAVYQLASLNAARSIGVEDCKGSIEIGKDADLVIWDEALEALVTIVEGKIVYER
ncbi:N-acetylglucosamine-6-phosphate deacetylase [Turicibacter sanguinis]|jgi:N-acetylglucosamine-6-phosphate deacetylase|uniref:N-acetylglucosamine-6-phosphate deacetylase n=1 Tax=Turicibacter sanguinis PC909 TaxID=702450 RepID=A0ABN0A0N7_9FIRM|nr:N-acetylglucosamine-6-phosphate deacetylase [Turicibacter sanguinis]EFF63195.1 N-acetylglucosamine-6-phosphate deacetylase [Turicibacter sanguinis PC909]MCU7192667.1 N-acetylglucosamine-6-phosphate deacetylase [Turicibacter sanguinis]MCU7198280.1 N-acetylglucosamine-6-phosphate deacetylase [Turicibacter sanguinis]MCU7203397.1 N-acetylglucosamine-6-phosphate deacetylase [Turicibacter sanguinis]MCU7212790.1 N-acetylglucosamine-6-phosphate deacetylase [Turicibacter sanguinis]